jgi:hypothetical protein
LHAFRPPNPVILTQPKAMHAVAWL